MHDQWKHKMFNVSPGDFEGLALEAFQFQYLQNPVYRQYVDALRIDVSAIRSREAIPFLPIRFFKSHIVTTGNFTPAVIFESSGTTTTVNSRHYVKDAELYRQSFLKAFKIFNGPLQEWCILGLLPSYLERNNSSLVFMVNEFIHQSAHPLSGFYLDDFGALQKTLDELERTGQRTLLIGVTFALLDFAEKFPQYLHHIRVMETGGMKGRRKEMIRAEVHAQLRKAFTLQAIHSEYGMTELLSQAYSPGDGFFSCPPWMQVLLRDEEDPLTIKAFNNNKRTAISGAINIIDLANIDSCCFIATDDAGRLHADGRFEVLGRMDNSDLRGCSLLTI